MRDFTTFKRTTVDLTKFKVFDEVRVKAMPAAYDPDFGPPKVGEIGVVVYMSPKDGYGIEKVSSKGHVEWLADFKPEQLEAA